MFELLKVSSDRLSVPDLVLPRAPSFQVELQRHFAPPGLTFGAGILLNALRGLLGRHPTKEHMRRVRVRKEPLNPPTQDFAVTPSNENKKPAM